MLDSARMQSIEIIFTYPTWYLILCAAFSAGAAWFLYKVKVFGEEDKLWLRRGLGALRFLFLFGLSFLLLEPLVKNQLRELEKPVVALVVDNSSSMRMQKDSAQLESEIKSCLEQLEKGLGDDHEVRVYLAGTDLNEDENPKFDEEASNLSKALKLLDNQYENQNLGAVVLFSDGLYNQGVNPVYQTRKAGAPLYTVAFGDTTLHRDLILEEVRQNRLAYLGNQFPLQVLCRASDLSGKNSKLVVRQNERVLFEKALSIDAEQWTQSIDVVLKAEKSGMIRYDISLESIDGEHNLRNNRKTIYMEVVDARNKVLLLAHAPHPDLKAMTAAIGANENYEVELMYARSFKEPKWSEINLLILHQLPSLQYPGDNILEKAESFGIPVLFVVGQATQLGLLNKWGRGLGIQTSVGSANESQGVINKDFELFRASEESSLAIKRFPPLFSPFGKYNELAKNQIFLYQKIGNIESNEPLIAFNEAQGQKLGMIYGEGYWRWRLYDFDQHQNHEASEEILQKIVQYLAAKKDTRPFKARPIKRRFEENERLKFQAELYNASYQLVNDPEVNLQIKNAEGEEYTFQFGRDQSAYSLDAGYLNPGDYRYTASVNYGGEQLFSEGLFSVSPLELEAINTRADFLLLRQLAEKNGGQNYMPTSMDKLIAAIQSNEKIHTVSFMRSSLEDLIRQPWIFWLLLSFISIEWFVRKYKGAY